MSHPRCLPPAEHLDKPWHWLKHWSTGLHAARWLYQVDWLNPELWAMTGRLVRSDAAASQGYSYHSPADPLDAQVRGFLEEENSRLRKALETIARAKAAKNQELRKIARDAAVYPAVSFYREK